ncbi:unnamed protein product [Hapterophycus canaliculatus]
MEVSAPPLVGPGKRWGRAKGPLRGRAATSLRLGRRGSNSAPAHLCCTRCISVNPTLERVRRQAMEEPASIRRFLETSAKELAIEARCTLVNLTTWTENPRGAETCGQLQAHV